MAELNTFVIAPHAIWHTGQEICVNIIKCMGYWYIRIQMFVSLDNFICLDLFKKTTLLSNGLLLKFSYI